MRESSVTCLQATLKPFFGRRRPTSALFVLGAWLGFRLLVAAPVLAQPASPAPSPGLGGDVPEDSASRAVGEGMRPEGSGSVLPGMGSATGPTQSAGGPSVQTTLTSPEQLYREGLAAIQANRFKAAVAALDTSYRLRPRPVTMYALALAYSGLGYPDKAVEAFAAYVEFADPQADAVTIAAVRKEMERITESVARFAVSLKPADAVIRIDGQPVTPKNDQLWLKPGQHRIAIQAPAHEPFAQDLDVRPGRFELDIRLRPLTVAPEVRANELLAEGDRLAASGDLMGAAALYDASHALVPTAHAAGAAGLAREQLGHLAQAEGQILEALHSPRDPWVRAHRAELRAARYRLERTLGEVTVHGDPVYVGAMVWVNGRSVGRLPLSGSQLARVEAGVVTVKATLAGFQEFQHELQMEAQGRQEVRVEMTKAPIVPTGLSLPPAEPGLAGGVNQSAAATSATVAMAAPAAAPSPPRAPLVADALEPVQPVPTGVATGEAEVGGYGLPIEAEPATGVEMAVGLGWQFVLSHGLAGSSGALAPRLFAVGYRPVWPFSFGVQLFNASVDFNHDDTRWIGAVHPGFYLRAHSQRYRAARMVDVWGGIGFQPLGFALARYSDGSQGSNAQDSSETADLDPDALAAALLNDEIHVGDLVSQQSYNIPLELGVAFYITPGLALELSSALTFWLPVQKCFFVNATSERLCFDEELKSQTTLYLGFGLSFLP